MRKIIDISSAQGKPSDGVIIHWAMLKELGGVDAVWAKSNDGIYEDVAWSTNERRADEIGFPLMAAYQWYYAPQVLPLQKGVSQARCFARTVGKKYTLVADYELDCYVNGKQKTYPADIPTYNDTYAYFSELDNLAGYAVPYYSGSPSMQKFLVLRDPTTGKQQWATDPITKKLYPLWPEWLTCRPLIFSAYPYRKTLSKGVAFDQWNLEHRTYGIPAMLATLTNVLHYPTDNLWMWQFDDKGIVPGIQGNQVDLNYEINPPINYLIHRV